MKVGSLIGVHITENDLSVSHRLPKQSYRDIVREGSQVSSNSRFRAPNIVVKFVRRELRDRFFQARKFLRDTMTTEDLDLGLHSESKIHISRNAKRSISKLLRKNRGLWAVYRLCYRCNTLVIKWQMKDWLKRKPPGYTFVWRNYRMCSPKRLLLVFLFGFNLSTDAHFHLAGR